METVNVLGGSTTPTAVFNANSPQFGLAAPAPTWVLPTTRRTDAQNTDEFKNMFGEGEYHGARDLTWSLGDKAFLVADETGLYKLSADGSTSTFIGDPGFGEGGLAGISFLNVGGRRLLFATTRDGSDLHQIGPATGLSSGDAFSITDVDGATLTGISSLVERPDGNALLGISNVPGSATGRQLISIDP